MQKVGFGLLHLEENLLNPSNLDVLECEKSLLFVLIFEEGKDQEMREEKWQIGRIKVGRE